MVGVPASRDGRVVIRALKRDTKWYYRTRVRITRTKKSGLPTPNYKRPLRGPTSNVNALKSVPHLFEKRRTKLYRYVCHAQALLFVGLIDSIWGPLDREP